MTGYGSEGLLKEVEAAERRVQRLELLLETALELSSERDLGRLLNRIWERLTQVMDAERSSLFLVDEERGEIWSRIAQGTEEIRFPIGKGIAGTVAKTGETINIPDAYRDPRFNPEFDRVNRFRTRSLLTVPMKDLDENIIGVAQVLNKCRNGRAFSDQDEALLSALASLAAVATETVNLYEEQRASIEAVITGLNIGLAGRDPSYGGHVFRVQAYSLALAEELGVSEEERKVLRYSALLHDLGQIGVPDAVLLKTSPLEREELLEYQLHALKTRILLEKMELRGELEEVPSVAPFNHKRMEGGGYPEGPPEGKEIPFLSRILAVADSLDNLTCPSFGQKELSFSEALGVVRKEAGRAFDPTVVEALVRVAPRLVDIRREAEASYEEVRVDLG